MWFFVKNGLLKCDICEKCEFESENFVKNVFWECEFLEWCDFEHVDFWIKFGFLPQCVFQWTIYGFKIGNNLWLWEINLKASKVTKPKLVTMETEKNVFMILHMLCWCCDVMTLFLLSFWQTEDLHCKFSFYDVGQKDNNNSWWCRKSREKMLSFPFICIFPRRINGL